jgi:hypothetical protein
MIMPVRESASSQSRELRLRLVTRPDRSVAQLLYTLGWNCPTPRKSCKMQWRKTAFETPLSFCANRFLSQN